MELYIAIFGNRTVKLAFGYTSFAFGLGPERSDSVRLIKFIDLLVNLVKQELYFLPFVNGMM